MPNREFDTRTETRSTLPRQVLERQRDEHEAQRIRLPQRGPFAPVISGIGDASSAGVHASMLNRATNGRPFRAGQSLLRLQRQYGNRYVQRVLALARKGAGETEVVPDVEQAIQRSRGGGQALDREVRSQMEPVFGADFSGVRVHTSAQSDTLNRELNARAFTTGQDIFFRQDAYNPGNSSGRELIAHELTHVVQQTGGTQPKLTVGQPSDKYEQEADQVAKAVIQHEQGVAQQEQDGGWIQRQIEEEALQTQVEEEPIQGRVGDLLARGKTDGEEAIQTKIKDMQVQRQDEHKLDSLSEKGLETVIQRKPEPLRQKNLNEALKSLVRLQTEGTLAIFAWLDWYANNMSLFYGQTSSAPSFGGSKTSLGSFTRKTIEGLGKKFVETGITKALTKTAVKTGITAATTIAVGSVVPIIGHVIGFIIGTAIVAAIDVATDKSGEYYALGSKASADLIRGNLREAAIPGAMAAQLGLQEMVRQLRSLFLTGNPKLTKPEEAQSTQGPSTAAQPTSGPLSPRLPIVEVCQWQTEADLAIWAFDIIIATDQIERLNKDDTSLYQNLLRQWVLEAAATPTEPREGVVEEQWEQAKGKSFKEGLLNMPDLFVYQTLGHWREIGLSEASAKEYEKFMRSRAKTVMETKEDPSDVALGIVDLFEDHKPFRFGTEDVVDAKRFVEFLDKESPWYIVITEEEKEEMEKDIREKRTKDWVLFFQLELDESDATAYVDEWRYKFKLAGELPWYSFHKTKSFEFEVSP